LLRQFSWVSSMTRSRRSIRDPRQRQAAQSFIWLRKLWTESLTSESTGKDLHPVFCDFFIQPKFSLKTFPRKRKKCAKSAFTLALDSDPKSSTPSIPSLQQSVSWFSNPGLQVDDLLQTKRASAGSSLLTAGAHPDH